MEDTGLIYRKQADGDYRKVLVFLTEKGVELRKLTKSTILEFNEKLKNRVSPAKLKSFYEVMKTIDNMVEKELNAHKNKKQFY